MDEYQPSWSDDRPLGQDLRAVGQAIEALRLRDFRVLTDEHDFLIKGQRTAWAKDPISSPRGAVADQAPDWVELRCTPEIISRIDVAGRANRSASNVMPDPLSPSQILRAVGNSLARRQAKLKRVERRGDNVIIEYESESGMTLIEERFISSFYDTSVRMHLDRADRSA